jgi:hypothetical protein
MMELTVPSIEDAVIRVSTAKEPLTRVIVDTHRSTFLAFNTAYGYSQVDFLRPSHRKIKELAALLKVHCDWDRTHRYYGGLYRDMISIVSPTTKVTFNKEQETAIDSPNPDFERDNITIATDRRTLVAFGDSNTYGTDLSEVELGRDDSSYREKHAYPQLLAHHLGIAYGGNLAEPGRGNNKILRRVCDFVANHRHELERCFLVILLTHPARKVFILKNSWEYLFINRDGGMEPKVLKPLCLELFYPDALDARLNEEFYHKYWVLTTFLSAVRCKHVIIPGWDFARSRQYFRDKNVNPEACFYFGADERHFGFHGAVNHLPRSSTYHPLSEGHALFARLLADTIHRKNLL